MKVFLKCNKFSLIVLLIISLVVSLTACSNNGKSDKKKKQASNYDKYVAKAIDMVNKEWEEIYKKYSSSDDATKFDNTVNIINTRVIGIKENSNKYFKDVDRVVEFEILSDYFGSAPYYLNIHNYDTVVFYKNGDKKIFNIFRDYSAKTYKYDYFDVIDEVVDLGTAYNTETKTDDLDAEREEYVKKSIKELKSHWRDESKNADGTLKILNTRVFTINGKTSYKYYNEYFTGVKAIVEFELYTDFYGSAPYYVNIGKANAVWIMEDGSVKMAEKLIPDIMKKTYVMDLGDLFAEIDNVGAKYNETFDLKNDKN